MKPVSGQVFFCLDQLTYGAANCWYIWLLHLKIRLINVHHDQEF